MAIARHAEARELACQSSCSLVLIWLAVLWGVPLGLLAGVYMPYTSGPVAY
jgi:ABC-type phosphate transport system permease subunit